jgi:hypothetical protein
VQVLNNDHEGPGGTQEPLARPAWLVTLERVVVQDPPLWARLPLAVLTHEVEHWCARGRAISWGHRNNPTSLHDDIQDTLKHLGPALKSEVARDIKTFTVQARCLQHKPAPTADQTRALRVASHALRESLRQPAALEAAWRDVWKAAQKEDLELLEWRMSCLLDLLDLAGKDDRWAFSESLLALHATVEGDRTSAPWKGRLDAAGRALSHVPSSAHCVVWLSYQNASLASLTGQRCGPVDLYEARWVVPNADKEDGHAFPYRDELRTLLAGRHGESWRDLGDSDGDRGNRVVLARVDLGVRASYGALEAADRVVQTMVELAAYRWGGSAWVPFGPAALWTDGTLRTTSFARSGPSDYTVASRRYQTAKGLSEHGEQVAVALTTGALRPDLVDAVRLLHEAAQLDEAVSTSRSTRSGVPASRIAVVLEDSAVEHLASVAGMTCDDLDSYILEGWAHSALSGRVRRALHLCVHSSATPHDGASESDLRQQLRRSTLGSPESFILAGTRMEEVIAMCDEPTITTYARRWLETLLDPRAYLARYEALVAAGDRLARRTMRVRNSVAHGNPADDGVVESVRALSRYRAHVALDVALASVTRGVPMVDELDRMRGAGNARLSALRSGTSWIDEMSAAV